MTQQAANEVATDTTTKKKQRGMIGFRNRNKSSKSDAKQLESQFEDATIRLQKMKEERDLNRDLLLRLTDVMQTLQRIPTKETNEDSGGYQVDSTEEIAFEHIKRKIDAVEEYQKHLVLQCENLKKEKALQEGTIQSQKSEILSLLYDIEIKPSQPADECTLLVEKKNPTKAIKVCTLKAKLETLTSYRDKHDREVELLKVNTALKEENMVKSHRIDFLESRLKELETIEAVGPLKSLHPIREIEEPQWDDEDTTSKSGSRKKRFVEFRPKVNENALTVYSKETSIKLASNSTGDIEVMVSKDPNIDISDVSYCSDDTSVYSSGSSLLDAQTTDSPSPVSPATLSNPNCGSTLSVYSGSSYDLGGEKKNIYKQLAKTQAKYDKLRQELDSALARVDEFQRTEKEYLELKQEHAFARGDIAQLKIENERLAGYKEGHGTALSSVANAEHEKLREDHAVLKAQISKLEGELAEYEALKGEHYFTKVKREEERAKHAKFSQFHDTVVAKLAGMGEENDRLKQESTTMKAKAAKMDEVKSRFANLRTVREEGKVDTTKLEETNGNYEKLQNSHDALKTQLDKANVRYEEVKEKYDKEHARLEKLEQTKAECAKLKEEHNVVVSKLEKMEQSQKRGEVFLTEHESNDELDDIKEVPRVIQTEPSTAEEQMASLQNELKQTKLKTILAKKKQKERAKHLQDVIFHYKNLQQEHEDVVKKLNRLEAEMGMPPASSRYEESARNAVKEISTKSEDSGKETSIISGEKDTKDQAAQTTEDLTEQVAKDFAALKELHVQRDAAISKMEAIEQDVSSAKTEIAEAKFQQEAREEDLKVVIQQYEKLQVDYQKVHAEHKKLNTTHTMLQIEHENLKSQHELTLERITNMAHKAKAVKQSSGKSISDNDSMNLHEDLKTVSSNGDSHSDASSTCCQAPPEGGEDDDSIEQLLSDVRKLHEEDTKTAKSKVRSYSFDGCNGSQEEGSGNMSVYEASENDEEEFHDSHDGSGPGRKKTTELLCELQKANGRYATLMQEYETKVSEMEVMERKLGMAKREAEVAKYSQTAREGSLRDAISKQMRLEKEYELTKGETVELKEEVETAKKEARKADYEAKGTRKRLTETVAQYKQLGDEYDAALVRIRQLERDLEESKLDAALGNDSGNIEQFRDDLMAERVKLFQENEKMKQQYRQEMMEERTRLLKEHKEMKQFCDELLNIVEKKGIEI
jgi:chromosome segregation ATPase